MKEKFCTNCGTAVEEGKSFCTKCGNNIIQDVDIQASPVIESTEKKVHEESRGAMQHLTLGFNVALNNPMVFLPAILSGVISLILSYSYNSTSTLGTLVMILGLVGTVISFILSFASIDMSRDAYDKQPLNLASSISYVFKRIVPFLLASIFGALLSITIVLIPAVILTFVIMVIDETGIMDAFTKAFNVIKADIVDIIIVLVVSIAGSFVIGYIPFISTLVNAALNVVIGLAFIDIYMNYKNK